LTTPFAGCRFADRCGEALPQCAGTVPPMVPVTASHGVRCLLHLPGAARPAQVAARAAASDLVPAAVRPPAGEPLLDVQDLRVRFVVRKGLWQRAAGHFDAVDGVSFRIDAGRTLALVGESGCGKTTTGKAVVQLLRGQAQLQGRALLDGRDLFAMDRAQLLAARRDVQIIFQDPFSSLDPRMRVFDILEEGLLALRPELDAPARRQRLEGLADQVGLRREALERYPHEFSGGQRQRIAIARALAVQPRLIVCDEPTSALDVSVQAQILNLLRQLQRDLGVAYLFITHNIGVVEYIADEVAVMRGGRLVEAGDAGTVLGHPAQDYTRQLLAAVPRLAVSV
jgi:peptide/nickel transport system ATP-binding protein